MEDSVDNPRLLVRVEEAAMMLGMIRSKLYKMLAEDNEIPVVRIGRLVRIPRHALQEWVVAHTEASNSDGAVPAAPDNTLSRSVKSKASS